MRTAKIWMAVVAILTLEIVATATAIKMFGLELGLDLALVLALAATIGVFLHQNSDSTSGSRYYLDVLMNRLLTAIIMALGLTVIPLKLGTGLIIAISIGALSGAWIVLNGRRAWRRYTGYYIEALTNERIRAAR